MALPAISARSACGRLDLAAMARAASWMRAIERRVGALGGIGRERAGDQRRLEHALGLEQAGERQAVENCVPLSSARPSFGPSTSGVEAGRRASASRRARARRRRSISPTPIIAAVMCASGARSPEAPTEPCAGNDRDDVRCQHALPAARCVASRTPEAPCARLASFSAIISRTTGDRQRLADAAACERTMLRCSVARSAVPMRTLASLPKPVLMP